MAEQNTSETLILISHDTNILKCKKCFHEFVLIAVLPPLKGKPGFWPHIKSNHCPYCGIKINS